MLASFACDPKNSKGRLYPEIDSLNILCPFVLDKVRIIESTAFRRLEHKTQVFVSNEGDHYRNRLTHSLEAAQTARIISEALSISADLAESLTLAHDIGHAAFGHAGEEALNDMMQQYNLAFDHNSHAIKLLTELEKKHPQFEGLNLSWETIEGIAKHNGPLFNLHPMSVILSYSQKHDLDLTKYSSLESQVSSLSDDITYNNHDIEDGFRAGLLSIEELCEVGMLGIFVNQVRCEYPKAEDHQIIYETLNRMKNAMIFNAIKNTKANIKNLGIETSEDIRSLNVPVATFTSHMESYHREIKKFLMIKVYKSNSVNLMANKGKNIIKDLFKLYMSNPEYLPARWQASICSKDKQKMAIIIGDFIACMSDRYAIAAHSSLFNHNGKL